MKKSETIIVSVTLLAALYGAADFLLGRRGDAPPIPASQASEAINAITTQMAALSSGQNKEIGRMGERLRSPWPEPLFHADTEASLFSVKTDTADSLAAADTAPFDPSAFSYSGFLQMAGRKIAIINGQDHEVGDALGLFVVAGIAPDKVTLAQGERTFEIPITRPEP